MPFNLISLFSLIMKIISPFVVESFIFVLCERQWHGLEKVLLNKFCGLSFTFTSFEAARLSTDRAGPATKCICLVRKRCWVRNRKRWSE